jgi:hypothetical protein
MVAKLAHANPMTVLRTIVQQVFSTNNAHTVYSKAIISTAVISRTCDIPMSKKK